MCLKVPPFSLSNINPLALVTHCFTGNSYSDRCVCVYVCMCVCSCVCVSVSAREHSCIYCVLANKYSTVMTMYMYLYLVLFVKIVKDHQDNIVSHLALCLTYLQCSISIARYAYDRYGRLQGWAFNGRIHTVCVLTKCQPRSQASPYYRVYVHVVLVVNRICVQRTVCLSISDRT